MSWEIRQKLETREQRNTNAEIDVITRACWWLSAIIADDEIINDFCIKEAAKMFPFIAPEAFFCGVLLRN